MSSEVQRGIQIMMVIFLLSGSVYSWIELSNAEDNVEQTDHNDELRSGLERTKSTMM